MKFHTLLACFILMMSLNAYSQSFEEPTINTLKFSERLVYGGNFGLAFGDQTLIDLSPTIGYRLSNQFTIGTGISYKYSQIKDYTLDMNSGKWYDYSSNVIGGSFWARYHIIENVFAHVEVEQLQINYNYTSVNGSEPTKIKDNAGVTSVLVGGGYRQPLGNRVYFNILLLYNLNETDFSPYKNPIIRAGISIGM
jgi:hypothetical protein